MHIGALVFTLLGCGAQVLFNEPQNGLWTVEHLLIRKTEHLVAQRGEVVAPSGIIFNLACFFVNAAVSLDNKLRLKADEVNYVPFNGVLAPKLVADLLAPQQFP